MLSESVIQILLHGVMVFRVTELYKRLVLFFGGVVGVQECLRSIQHKD